jgi:hypothetical protein
MRLSSLLKVVLPGIAIAFTVSLPEASSARMMRAAPNGDCVFRHKIIANGRWCSYRCDRANVTCEQQVCWNGVWEPKNVCIEPFCTARCER